MSKYDLVVIGAGPGGYPAAIRAAQLGLKTAIVEKEAFGGTCLNWGCIPTKALLASASLYYQARSCDGMGVKFGDASFDYKAMVERKNGIVSKLTGGVQQLLKAHGVEVITGTARFETAQQLSVLSETGETRWLTASRVIIAAGSVSAMPGFIPRHRRVVESRKFLDLTQLPKSLVILGGGVIGCEFACLAAQLGVKVTMVEMLEDILPVVDRDVRRVLRKQLEVLGVVIRTGAPLQDIKANDKGVSGRFNEETITGDMLLVAIGRTADTAALNLERAGVSADERGLISVDSSCRTSVPAIFAVGDIVAGNQQLAHVATSQGVLAAEVAAGQRRKIETVIPSCIFTTPEIGVVGLTEAQAKTDGREIKVAKFSFMALGKALAAGTPEGFVKLIADPENDQLLGAQVVGANATELIATAALAIRNELTSLEFGRTIHSHPTMAESWMEAAHALHDACVHTPPRRRRG